ncbi:MAG: YbaK/EbsC family protein [Thermovirgaceae bacterium]
MKMSRLFAPTMKEKPKGVSDPALQRLIRGGYVAPPEVQETLCLFPLGKRLWRKSGNRAEEALQSAGFQGVRFDDLEKKLIPVLAGYIKSYRHLPLLFYQACGDGFELSAVEEDRVTASDRVSELLEKLRQVFSTERQDALSGETISERGREKFLAIPVKKTVPFSRAGYRCTFCHWCGDENSPVGSPFPESEGTPGKPEPVDTPGADTIAELCSQLDVPPEKTLKTMFYAAEGEGGKEIFVVLVRGDHRISETKVKNVLGVPSLRFADPLEIRETVGDLAGYLGPVGLPKGLKVIADRHVEGVVNIVTGANEPGRHLANVCWGRDFTATSVEDIICFEMDRPCPACGAPLESTALACFAWAIVPESSLSEESEVSFQATDGTKKRPFSWSGRIDLDAACLGLIPAEGPFPVSFAPFDVSVIVASLKNQDAVDAALAIVKELEAAGGDVLHDERDERAGVKFSDAEIIGAPVTVVCGRDASEGKAELRMPDGCKELVPLEEISSRVFGVLSGKKAEGENQ